jgi:hypothetical protein
MRIFRIKSPFTNTHYEVVIQKKQYSNGRPALILLDFEDGSPYAVATVNLPELNLEDNQTFVKSYSENAGMLEFLVENKIVKYTGKQVSNGFVTVDVVELVPETNWGNIPKDGEASVS